MIEIIIVLSILSIVAIVSVPNYVKSRDAAQRSTCIRNLRVIEHAVQEWAFEKRKMGDDPYSLNDASVLAHFRSSRLPLCPGGGVYTPGATVVDVPACSVPGHTL